MWGNKKLVDGFDGQTLVAGRKYLALLGSESAFWAFHSPFMAI